MIEYTIHSSPAHLEPKNEAEIVTFLFKHLGKYGDSEADIQKATDYALGRNQKPGGLILSAKDTDRDQFVGVVVINSTGMESYIPENILVYIATHEEYRGQGIGKKLMQIAIERTKGSIALHVEPDNPAKKLYEKLGFTNKYLEMRLNK